MTGPAVARCFRCKNTMLLLPFRQHGRWEQAVVCPKCDSVNLMPRGKEPPDEAKEPAAV